MSRSAYPDPERGRHMAAKANVGPLNSGMLEAASRKKMMPHNLLILVIKGWLAAAAPSAGLQA